MTDEFLTDNTAPAEDDLAIWTARLALTCGGCGLRPLDGTGRCPKCGSRKAAVEVVEECP